MNRLSAYSGLAVLLLSLACIEAHADIYKWIDDQGTMHFTDDPSSIPPSKRDQSTAPFIKEPVPSTEPLSPPSPPVTISAPGPETLSPGPGENGAEALRREIEQLKAKIAAKESHVSAVDAKRSLATNPLRNRIVSAADLDLYQKYQAELPGDRDRLRQLEAQLQGNP
jgi:hypothetical protein